MGPSGESYQYTDRLNTQAFVSGERYRVLDRHQQYYDCTQHDWKVFDFDGRAIKPGPPTSQPLLSSEVASWFVPLRARRPSHPVRLGKLIVNAFTGLLFGEQRFPTPTVAGDPDSQDFAEALVSSAEMSAKFSMGRALGGSMGTVGFSWCFRDGKPRVSVHNAKHLFVQRWRDREELIPDHVTEVYRYSQDEWDQEKRRVEQKWYWHRRDWTPDEDIVYLPVECKDGQEPVWEVDVQASNKHEDGECHFVWVQNFPTEGIDGLPDYDGVLENMDSVDVLSSVLLRGTTLNLDPTLVLKMDRNYVQMMGVKKGSDNALAVGETGDARYLELSGSSVQAGLQLYDAAKKNVLDVVQCVLTDPNVVAAQGISSVALKVIYAAMIQRTDLLRVQYGNAIKRILEQMIRVARKKYGEVIVLVGEDGEEESARYVVDLPPKLATITEEGLDGEPVEKQVLQERNPGAGEKVELQWGPYFLPTPADQQSTAITLSTATGGKAIMSKRTAVEVMASTLGRNPTEEWNRVNGDDAARRAQEAEMLQGDTGGEVESEAAMPAGAQSKDQKIQLTATDIATIVFVNEARASQGLGPLLKEDGTPDPDGKLTVAEFKAKRAALIAIGAVAEQGKDPTAPLPPADAAPPGGPPGRF